MHLFIYHFIIIRGRVCFWKERDVEILGDIERDTVREIERERAMFRE